VVGIKGEKDIRMLTGKKQNSARKARQATFRRFVVGAGSVSLKAEERKVYVKRQHKGPSRNKANSQPFSDRHISRITFAYRHDSGNSYIYYGFHT